MKARLDSVCEIIMGQAPAGDEYNDKGEGLPLLAGAGDFKNGRPAAKKFTRVVTKECLAGDLVIGIRASIGDKVIADRPYCLGLGVAVIRPKTKDMVSRYLWHWMEAVRPELERKAKGATFKQVNRADIGELVVALPKPEEQQRIAAILDQAEELRAKRRTAIALLDQLPQAIFLEMFRDPAANPMGWPVVQIGDLLESANYGSSGKAGLVGAWPILRMGNLTVEGHLDLEDLKYIDLAPNEIPKYTVRNGDLLFNRTNSADLVGKTALYTCDEPAAFAGYLVRLRVNERANPEFVAAFMNLGYTKRVLRSMAKSIVGMANINAKEVQAIAIPLPPFELQSQFAERVQVIRDAKAAHQSALAELDTLFVSLQAEAFERRF